MNIPSPCATELLKTAHIRPTRQRLMIAERLFDGHDKHITAEQLHSEMTSGGIRIALATIYNTLHHFTAVGLLRQVVVDARRVYFDTHIAPHLHFYDPHSGMVSDVPYHYGTIFTSLPTPPDGREIDSVEVMIRLR
jgi:Fur family transcriptional regulator, iron response regulator